MRTHCLFHPNYARNASLPRLWPCCESASAAVASSATAGAQQSAAIMLSGALDGDLAVGTQDERRVLE